LAIPLLPSDPEQLIGEKKEKVKCCFSEAYLTTVPLKLGLFGEFRLKDTQSHDDNGKIGVAIFERRT